MEYKRISREEAKTLVDLLTKVGKKVEFDKDGYLMFTDDRMVCYMDVNIKHLNIKSLDALNKENTNLKDKNGNLIYADDIVTDTRDGLTGKVIYDHVFKDWVIDKLDSENSWRVAKGFSEKYWEIVKVVEESRLMDRERIKALIELSLNVDDADKVIANEVGLTDLKEKLSFLKGMFQAIEIVPRDTSYANEFIYKLWLQEIIDGHCS